MTGSALARAIARGVVHLASLRAPAGPRDAMRREWHGEVSREVDAGRGWSAVSAAFGSFADARALRELERTEYGRRTMGEGIQELGKEMSVALRSLLRAPGFALVAAGTLAIGLGGSAAVYTLLDRVVLDPLPYPESERLVRMENVVPGVGDDVVWSLSTAQWVHYGDHATSIESVGLYREAGGNIVTPDGPRRARSVRVTASMMSLLGAEASTGRLITEADDHPGAGQTAVLSHAFWRGAFASDPDIVGTTISVDDQPIEIIGVLAEDVPVPGWTASNAPDLWIPMQLSRDSGFGNSHVFPAIARLAPDATAETVSAEMERLVPQLIESYPNVYQQGFFDRYGFRTVAVPLRASVLGDLAQQVWLLFAGVGLVLLIATANVANLFLVRFEGKRREIAIRRALGAGRGSVARHLLAESLVLAFVGGATAITVGTWGVPALARLAPDELPRVAGVALGLDTVLFTLLLSAAIGAAVAALPILSRVATVGDIGDGGRGNSAGVERQRARGALVVTQMALAITLLVGAGLLVESLRTLSRAETGFEADRALAVDLYMNPFRQQTDQDLWNDYQEILARVDEIPGVSAVGMGEEVPVSGRYGCTVQGFEEQSVMDRIRELGMTTCAGQERVTPGYFEALGIPVLEGRALDAGDNADPSRSSVVVSAAFAERFWPGENPIGKGVGPNSRTIEPFYRVVGVVGDVRRRSEGGAPPLSQDAMAIYYPVVYNPEAPQWGGWWAGTMTLVVRAEVGDPMSLLPAMRGAIAGVDPDIPLVQPRAMTDVVDGARADLSFVSLLMAIAAAVALLLSAVGLYGVIAYVVSRRTREIGTRLAMGAHPGVVVRSVVSQTLRLALAGIVVGIPLAVLASRLGRSVLVGVEPTDLFAYAVAALALAVVALLASFLPARRAARVDPMTALRTE